MTRQTQPQTIHTYILPLSPLFSNHPKISTPKSKASKKKQLFSTSLSLAIIIVLLVHFNNINIMGSIKMAKRNSDVGRRAWNILRLALLWARKGGVFRRRLVTELRLFPKFVRGLRHVDTTSSSRNGIIRYGERQLSFDKTPIFPRVTVKVNGSSSMRFLHNHIPCLNPSVVDFDDYDFGREEYDVAYDSARKSFLTNGEDQAYYNGEEEEDQEEGYVSFEENDNEEKNIDTRAEEFIAKFYEQIKLQRQISYLQYNEMLNRGTC